MITYEEVARTIGALVDDKNKAYGSSFTHSGAILKVLYPNGITLDKYDDLLCMVRVIDKLFRIATNNDDAFNESPWQDIAGYGILKAAESYTEVEEGEQAIKQIAAQVVELET